MGNWDLAVEAALERGNRCASDVENRLVELLNQLVRRGDLERIELSNPSCLWLFSIVGEIVDRLPEVAMALGELLLAKDRPSDSIHLFQRAMLGKFPTETQMFRRSPASFCLS